MKRFLVSLSIGTVLALMVYLGFAIPAYYDLLAHQPHWIVVDDTKHPLVTQHLSLTLPKTDGQEPHLGSTVPNPTSFPPSYAFFAMLPFAMITLVVVTLLTWLGQGVSKKKES